LSWYVHVAARLLCPWDSPGKNTGVGCMGGESGLALVAFIPLGWEPRKRGCQVALATESRQGCPQDQDEKREMR